jgi:hypothetical protein
MANEMANVVSNILAYVGALTIAGGGLSVMVYTAFKYLGEKWLTATFDQRLAAYKHAQEQELEQLKFKISTLMDRTVKLHQREFEVLPELWGRLIEAHGVVVPTISPFQQYPDLDGMNEAQLDEFLQSSTLLIWQQDELKRQTGKVKYYSKAIFWDRLRRAREASREFHVYMLKNGIFVPAPMKSQFTEMDKIMYDALLEHELNETLDTKPRPRDASKILNERGRDLLKLLEEEVQNRLWTSDAILGEIPARTEKEAKGLHEPTLTPLS